MSRRGWALFGAMAVIWGVPYLLIKVAVDDLGPGTLVFVRTGIGALLLIPVAASRDALRPLLPRWRIVLAYTVVEVAIPWFLLSDAERHLSSSLAGLLVSAVPLVGAVLALVTLGERLSGGRVVGLLVGLAGVGILLGFDVGRGDLGAVAEIALVTVGYAVGPMLIATRLRDLPAIGVVTASLAVTALAYSPFGITHLPASWPSTRVLVAIAVLSVLCTSLAFLVFFALIAEVGPARATVITYVNPAVAVALGVSLLGEPFTAGTAAGFALILGGCFLATRRGGRVAEVALAQPSPAPALDTEPEVVGSAG